MAAPMLSRGRRLVAARVLERKGLMHPSMLDVQTVVREGRR